ncbi:MAG: SIS domain-containing protein [Syntrophobacteraceae bacterium]
MLSNAVASARAKADTFQQHIPTSTITGTRVLRLEAKALYELATKLDESFDEAISLVLRTSGRIILTGMGKSGHVARKISATFASTGTPSFFVHPSEAGHGDLGMIFKRDAVIALSNSGETSELSSIIEYTRRFSIPLVAMTSNPDSTLARHAHCTLVTPKFPEACPHGLAPTTSTTMMLALGDALAIALLERRGFSAQDFKVFHPGGNLGARLQLVRDLMHHGDDMPLVSPETNMRETVIIMTTKRLGCAGVIENGRLIGIITDGDLRRHMDKSLISLTAREVMTPNPKTILPSSLAAEAVAVMHKNHISNLFVVEVGCPVGVLHLHDCLRAGIE